VITERSAWIKEMLASLKALPLQSLEAFRADSRNIAAAESYLRRALEAFFDLGFRITPIWWIKNCKTQILGPTFLSKSLIRRKRSIIERKKGEIPCPM
jgi:hypothetical protein